MSQESGQSSAQGSATTISSHHASTIHDESHPHFHSIGKPGANPSNQFAKECLAEALIKLLEGHALSEISVTDICKEAGFSRMTYYRNFQSKEDILTQYLHNMVDSFRRDCLERYPGKNSRSYELIHHGLAFFRQYRVVLQRLIDANLISILQESLNYYFETHIAGENPDMGRHYEMYYYSGALVNIFSLWISRDLAESPEELARIIYNIVNK